MTARYEGNLEKTESQRKEIITQAKAEAERLLADANVKIEKTIREIKEAQAEKEQTKVARKELENFKEKIQSQATSKPLNLLKPQKPIQPVNRQLPNSEIAIGDPVRLKGQQSTGTILEIKGKNATIAFGTLKTSVKLDQLEKVSRNQIRKAENRITAPVSNNADAMNDKKLHFKPEIDLRGMRGDEALQAVIYYIDDAIQCNVGRVRILHGTGTGALRQIVREYLKTVSGVNRFKDEHVQLGGTGITVVELE